MKRIVKSLTCAVFVLAAASLQAGLSDVEITASKQKLEENKSKDGISLVNSKSIAYDITIKSKTSKPLENLDVKYMIFYEDSQPGKVEKAEEKSHAGSEKVALLEANRSVTIATKPLTLTTEELPAGWVYTSGATGRSKDRTKGIWVRVYAGDKLLSEYANPTSIAKREWKD